jgi:hypothetical protein
MPARPYRPTETAAPASVIPVCREERSRVLTDLHSWRFHPKKRTGQISSRRWSGKGAPEHRDSENPNQRSRTALRACSALCLQQLANTHFFQPRQIENFALPPDRCLRPNSYSLTHFERWGERKPRSLVGDASILNVCRKLAPNRRNTGQNGWVIAVAWTWLLIPFSILTVCVLAGRAHSRYLDRLQARSNFEILTLSHGSANPDDLGAPGTGAQISIAVAMGRQIWIGSVAAPQAGRTFGGQEPAPSDRVADTTNDTDSIQTWPTGNPPRAA